MTHTKTLPLEDYKEGRERLRKWRAEQLARLETTPEFQVIAKLVENWDSTPAVTLQQFLELTTSSRGSGTVHGHCYRTSSFLLALSSRTPHEQQSKLVTFMVELKKITILDQQTGEPLLCEANDGLVWTELPTFGADFSNELHDRWPGSDKTPEDAYESENLNAFNAQIGAAGIWTGNTFRWPALIFRNAWPNLLKGHTIYYVRVACLWYIYAADAIWAATLDKENDVWTRELWNKYKECLLDSQARMRNQEAKKLIDRAVVQMNRAEGRGSV